MFASAFPFPVPLPDAIPHFHFHFLVSQILFFEWKQTKTHNRFGNALPVLYTPSPPWGAAPHRLGPDHLSRAAAWFIPEQVVVALSLLGLRWVAESV